MASPTLQQDPDLAVLLRSLEAWNRHDIEGFLDCLTDDIYWDDPPMYAPKGCQLTCRTRFEAALYRS